MALRLLPTSLVHYSTHISPSTKSLAPISSYLPAHLNQSSKILKPRLNFKIRRHEWGINVGDEIYEVDDAVEDDVEETLDVIDDTTDKISDMDTLYGLMERPIHKTATGTDALEATTVVGYKINEDEFHKFSLQDCDFFIRKVEDRDNDLYNFSEMYVSPPDTDVYSIPTIIGRMPKQHVRCRKQRWRLVCSTETKSNNPRDPMGRTEYKTLKVFLMKHYKNRRYNSENFVLNLEKIYVIDSKTKSISKANVKVEVPGGKDRDRTLETLIVRDSGTTFHIISSDKKKSPDQIIQGVKWERTRGEMERYLRSFRDYEVSNWF